MLITEHPGTSSTGRVHKKTAGGENGEDSGDDEGFMHEDSDVAPDEETSLRDMDDNDDDDDDDDDDNETGAESSGVDPESVGDIVLDVHNTRVKYRVLF